MKLTTHQSAKSSHYNTEAEVYDIFNQDSWVTQVNQTLEKILRKYPVKTILDLTCGTGSQVFWLTQCGYKVVGSDFNLKMLNIARKKANQFKRPLKFFKGDMRTAQYGQFDAAITIANAVGHLTQTDFEKTMKNIHRNLKNNGIYIFDIYNLDCLIKDSNITKLTIDWFKRTDKKSVREIQYSTIDNHGILASYTTSYEQKNSQKPKVTNHSQTLQIYTAQQLKKMLNSNGFRVLGVYGIDGSKFSKTKTEAMLTVTQKIN